MIGTPRKPELPTRIKRKLRALRWWIRAYVALRGVARALVWLATAFWCHLAIDRLFEPSVEIRVVLLVVVGVGLSWIVYRDLLRLLWVPLADRSMALLIERRNREFGESLITTVDLAGGGREEPCDGLLLARACRRADEGVERVRLSSIFRWRPLGRVVLMALMLVASIAAFRLASPESFAVWTERALALSPEPWPRKARLVVEGFEEHVVKVARGTDCEVVVHVDLSRPLVPDVVRLRARTEDGPLAPVNMTREGSADRSVARYQRFAHTFHGVLTPISFEVLGGDVRLDGYRIEVVESPRLIETSLELVYPAYMGRASRTVPVTGVMAIPEGTDVTLRAICNKSLDHVLVDREEEFQRIEHKDVGRLQRLVARQEAQIDSDAVELGGASQRALAYETESLVRRLRRQWPTESEFAGRLLAVAREMRRAAARLDEARPRPAVEQLQRATAEVEERLPTVESAPGAWQGAVRAVRLGADRLESLALREQEARRRQGRILDDLREIVPIAGASLDMRQFEFRVGRLEEDSLLKIRLSDRDGIESREPIRVTLARLEDQPPQVDARLEGIGNAITPDARLPIRLAITDDHGVAEAWFEYAIDDGTSVSKPIATRSDNATRVELSEFFDVRDLSVDPGQKILVTAKASDRYNLGEGKQAGSADHWLLDIVTPKQLLSMLESREIALRQRFEVIVDEATELRDALIRLEFDDPAAKADGPSGTDDRGQGTRRLRIQRAIQDARKGAHETLAMAEAFDSIREELINNRIYTEELRDRIDRDIARPLHKIVEEMFPALESRLRGLEEVAEDAARGPAAKDQARQQSQAIVLAMRAVLDRMLEMESFNEAVDLLRSIIRQQEELQLRTREQQKQKLRDLLEGL